MGGYIGSKAVNLSTTAADVTGNATIGGNLTVTGTTVTIDSANAQTVDLGDNDKIRLGDGDDLQIYHDGSHSYVDDTGTGRLYLRGNDRVQIQKYTGDDMITAIADGAVKLYYDNSNKLETTSSGVTITGDLAVTSGTDAALSVNDAVGEVGSGNLALQVTNSAGSALKPLGFRAEDIRFATGSSERMRIDGGGTLAVGTTDTHTWNTFDGRIRVGARGSVATTTGSTQVGHNWYYNSGYKYIGADHATRVVQAGGYVSIETAASGSADGAITFSEKARFLNDGGLAFNGDTAAANALSDYEEGIAQLTITTGSGTIGLANGGNGAYYTKIGRLVTIGARLDVASVSSPSGQLYITGLPFVGLFDHDTAGQNAVTVIIFSPSTNLEYNLCGEITNSHSTSILLRDKMGFTGGVAAVADHIDSGSLIAFTATYVAAS